MLVMKSSLPEKTVAFVVDALTKARKDQGMSHDKLANATGLSRPAISLIESGKRQPTLLTCIKIATALGLSLGELLIKAEKK